MNVFHLFFEPAPLADFPCVLPPPLPARRPKPVEVPKPSDMYLIDQATNSYGFHQATAVQQRRGAVETLTQTDIAQLVLRGVWSEDTAKKAKVSRANTAALKAHWAKGAMPAQIESLMGLSESWAEKRFAAFEAALKIDGGE